MTPRCPRCRGRLWGVERDDATVALLCLCCGERRVLPDRAREAALAADARSAMGETRRRPGRPPKVREGVAG